MSGSCVEFKTHLFFLFKLGDSLLQRPLFSFKKLIKPHSADSALACPSLAFPWQIKIVFFYLHNLPESSRLYFRGVTSLKGEQRSRSEHRVPIKRGDPREVTRYGFALIKNLSNTRQETSFYRAPEQESNLAETDCTRRLFLQGFKLPPLSKFSFRERSR